MCWCTPQLTEGKSTRKEGALRGVIHLQPFMLLCLFLESQVICYTTLKISKINSLFGDNSNNTKAAQIVFIEGNGLLVSLLLKASSGPSSLLNSIY